MKNRLPLLRPTATELEILATLWERGPSTVREIFEALSSVRNTGYTTVLKLMQIMTAKGLLMRLETQRAHVYEVSVPQEETQRQLLEDLARRAFGRSMARLIQEAISATGTASAEEIEEIQARLSRLERQHVKMKAEN